MHDYWDIVNIGYKRAGGSVAQFMITIAKEKSAITATAVLRENKCRDNFLSFVQEHFASMCRKGYILERKLILQDGDPQQNTSKLRNCLV